MSDRTIYPAGICVACERPATSMPLCAECRVTLWSHDGDTWEARDSDSQHKRNLAAAWVRGYHRGYALA